MDSLVQHHIKSIFSIYRHYFDGAYAEGYGAELHNLIKEYGIIKFISELSLFETRVYTFRILDLVASDIVYFSGDVSQIDDYIVLIEEYLQFDITNREKAICYFLLDEFERKN